MDDAVDLDASDSGSEPGATPATQESAESPRLRRMALVFIGGVLAAMVVAFTLSTVRGPSGPWLGEYFEGKEFEGDATIRYTRKLEFDWGKERPFRGMPKDKWSAIYTTCLVVEEEAEYRFRLTSDDGSRLYIDDDKIVENWGPHSPRTRNGKMLLEPGTYELVVEYFEASHGAVLKLVVAIGEGEKHKTLPPDMLRQPSDDSENRCG